MPRNPLPNHPPHLTSSLIPLLPPIPFLCSNQTKSKPNIIMDYYKILGLNTNATKDEIKESFRTIAKKFHPDKHSSSPKSVRDGATIKFKQASEAYEVLSDDYKRADYNLKFNRGNYQSGGNSGYGNYGYGYTYDNRKTNSSSNYGTRRAGNVSKFQIAIGYMNSRAFLLNLAFAGAIVSGLAVVEIGRDVIWRSQNPGKSFEEAMESIEKSKEVKEKE